MQHSECPLGLSHNLFCFRGFILFWGNSRAYRFLLLLLFLIRFFFFFSLFVIYLVTEAGAPINNAMTEKAKNDGKILFIINFNFNSPGSHKFRKVFKFLKTE